MSAKKEPETVGFWLPKQSSAKMDILTPHKLAVVFLIQEYLSLKKVAEDNAQIRFTARDRRRFCLLLLKLIQYPDMAYKDLYGLLTSPVYGIHRTHLEEFEKLMKMLKTVGIEVLFDLYNVIDKLISDNGSSYQIGIVGLYFRRVYITLVKMSFPEFMALYRNSVAYYEKGVRAVQISSSSFSNSESFMKLEAQAVYKDRNSASKWSNKQSELFVAQQSLLLQNNETNALNPKDMQNRLNEIIHDHPLYSQAYFLSYLNSVRVRDFFNAVDAIHRSFDRSALISMALAQDSKEYQYSALNLAILHAQFNHNDEALASIKECIMLAQENSDKICLQLAHAWLCLLDASKPQFSEKNIANKELITLVHSISLGIQSLVKSSASTGYTPAKLFEVLLKSDILNCQTSMMDLTANGIAERAALWAMYGKNEVSSLCSQLLLNSDLKLLVQTYNGEGICQALCSLVVWLAIQGEFNLALTVLKHTQERFPRYPLSKSWMTADYYITSMQAIFRGEWTDASNACYHLYTLDKHLSLLQRAHLALARLNLKSADQLLRQILDDDTIEPLTRVRALLLTAHTLTSLPDASKMEVVNVLNDALAIANKNYLDYEKALIEMHFAHVLMLLKLPNQALKAVKNCLENILANGGIYDKAKVLFLFVKCVLAVELAAEDKLTKIGKCLPMLEQAVEYFQKLECYAKVKDVYIFLANFYHTLEIPEERNKFAYKYRLIEEQYPTTREYLNLFF
ncbi:anaphase-promoting complex subunit 5 [Wyeomyia smithii]|uniref:anaphase-promoting complex subunit 5 n=1 Tax=Wyeomyia smithii TaxID=174621 RepID=UPI002467E462|nr:anaphase-promoting complex subunit 5 [Wyeomyia smithii]XP_055538252.1 anaphase-promoting complex subunit 5 [Wyeomyia smithii]